MKKLLVVGATLLVLALLFLLVPASLSGASAEDFHIEGTTLVDYTGTASNVTIPDTVEIIGRSAFENNQVVKKVVIPASVKTIEEYAFWGCGKLESVALGKGLKEISDFAFSSCEKLKEVMIPENITRIGIMTFADCTGLEKIYIPPTVMDIHSTAFDGVYFLEIEAEEFSYAYRYAVARGEQVANAPEYLKATPTPVPTEVPTNTPIPTIEPQPTPTPVPGVVIGSTSIVGNEAVVFMDSRDMDSLEGYEGFYGDGAGGVGDAGGSGNGTTPTKHPIEDWTYYGDENLIQITLDDNISAIGSFSFSRSGLQSIEIPEGTQRIEYAAFYHCDSLEDVVIPDSVTYIGEKAFAFTPWLESFYNGSMKLDKNSDFLIVGDGVLIAYRGNAENVEIPAEVKTIAPGAFQR